MAAAESDPELMAMLAQAAVSIRLKVNRPPCPEPSRLDDWFLGAGRSSQPQSTPVPFFPEMHEGPPGGTWTFPRWRERLRCTCARKTPPLGGIVGISRPKACKLTAALAAKTYSAVGQDASALHAIPENKPALALYGPT